MNARWMLPDPPSPERAVQVACLARELGCGPTVAAFLVQRGLAAPEQALEFLSPKLKSLSDPFLLPDMRPAVERILAAVDRRERIVAYGDYDVDGVTSLALLTRILRAYGAAPECFLPDRIEEGYGLSADGVARCVADYIPELLIAVDCGTSSADEIATLTARGIDVIVIDHHECKQDLPRCTAVVNPKRPRDGSAAPGTESDDYRYLCSAGLIFKLCHALLKTRALPDFDLREHLDLVALGTVADIVPLIRENRVLVQRGLLQIANTRWPGLRALMDVAGVKLPLTAGHVGFQIGPRLNAAGRLGTARDALELLLTDDPGKARTLALALDGQNRDRQQVEKKTAAEAEAQVAFDPARDAALVLGAQGWHPGVLGIVASRISKKYYRPTFVIGFDENGIGKGSGRSIDGLSLVAALSQCGHLLEKFGGHEMAAGLTMRQERFEEFRREFCKSSREALSDTDLLPRVQLDCEVRLSELTLDFLALHDRLQPFGMGNAQPLFFARGIRPVAEPRVLKEKHLKFVLGQNGTTHEAMFFNAAADALPRPPWDIAFRIERNEWRGAVSVQIQIQRIRSASE
ncbi:MAG: single-stranded-DNA-specific exonuclease RecJ [Verrucomicrobiota bacterium]